MTPLARACVAVALLASGCPSDDGNIASPAESSSSGANASSSTNDATSSGSTGAVPVCGNGVIEAGELCDGAPVAGVACPESCTFEPGSELWYLSYGDPVDLDSCGGVAIDGQGRIVVAGGAALPGWKSFDAAANELASASLPMHMAAIGIHGVVATEDEVTVLAGHVFDGTWVGGYSHDGTLNWELWEQVEEPKSNALPGSIALDEDGAVFVVYKDSLGGERPGYAMWIDGGIVTERWQFTGPQISVGLDVTSYGVLRAMPISPTRYLVSGRVAVSGTNDAFLALHEGEAPAVWRQFAGLGSDIGVPYSQALLLPNDQFAVGWSTLRDDGSSEAIVSAYDLSGELAWETKWDDPPYRVEVRRLAQHADGRIVAIGSWQDFAGAQAAHNYDQILLTYAPSGELLWTKRYSRHEDPEGGSNWDYGIGIAVHPDGFVVTCANSYIPGREYEIVVRAVAP